MGDQDKDSGAHGPKLEGGHASLLKNISNNFYQEANVKLLLTARA
jgi:hypothetical protein